MLKNESIKEDANFSFASLGIKESILKVITDLGLKIPTPIQHQAIPAALSGEDLVGIAQTGTGKTFAFGIPMLQRLAQVKGRGLILLPTRELAGQVEKSLHSLGDPLGLRTVCLIGGEAIGRQLNSLRRRPHVIVATPGRLIDHLKRGSVKLDDVSVLVLDEADMMFDMGFAPQIEEVLKRVPAQRQTLLFSATMPASVMRLAEKHLRTPVRIEVSPAGTTAELVEQEMYLLPRDSRFDQLLLLLAEYKASVLIFVRTKHGASKLTKKLQSFNFTAAEIHSNLSFPQRQAALAGFRSGKHRILVATDVAARGLDINDIELVLNFDLPDNSEDYVHRIGRTARAGKKGKAISFVAPDQRREIQKIERLIRQVLPVKQLKGGGATGNSFPRTTPSKRKFSPGITEVKKFAHSGPSRRKSRPLSERKSNYSSLGFKKRAKTADVTATPDYLQPSARKAGESSKSPVRTNNSKRTTEYSQKKTYPAKKTSYNKNTAAPVKEGNNAKTTQSRRRKVLPAPPIVNPDFDGGNRYAFRRAMFLLKEEAKGRPIPRKSNYNKAMKEAPKKEIKERAPLKKDYNAPRASAPSAGGRFSSRQVGVRSSGSKIFKSSGTIKTNEDQAVTGKTVSKVKKFGTRFKKK